MLPRFRVLIPVLMTALLGLGLAIDPATAAPARVAGLSKSTEDFYTAKLIARWKPVPGATYQVRWATSVAALGRATVRPVQAATASASGLNRCATHYLQVRAIKRGVVGRWSAPKALKFKNKYPKPAVLSGTGLENAVRFTWTYAANASRYRLRWNAAEWGKFEGGDSVVGGGWLNQHARSATVKLPATPAAGDKFMGVAYANPVFGQIDSNNPCRRGTPHSKYVPVFPKAPVPGPGDHLRMGSYNTELFPNNAANPVRTTGLARNISEHRLTVVALQEANAATAASLDAKLPTRWRVAPSQRNAGQQILYDGDVFRARSSGVFAVPNPKPGAKPLPTPWVVLQQLRPTRASSQDLFVVSIHYAENSSKPALEKKRDAHISAISTLKSIEAANVADLPVIVAGDFRYLREPFVDRPGYVEGPPTFVRAGYFDAMAAVKKSGFQYATVNQHKIQKPSPSGVHSRADYLLLKGFEGSRNYVNVANWRYNGTFVSDHNLIYADLTIPYN